MVGGREWGIERALLDGPWLWEPQQHSGQCQLPLGQLGQFIAFGQLVLFPPLSHIIVALVADAIVVAAVTVVIIVSRLLYTNALAQHFWQPPEKGSNKFDFAQLR